MQRNYVESAMPALQNPVQLESKPSILPPDLALVVAHWAELPEAVRASILALVQGAQ
jgi:hypothetical protein